MKLKLAAVLGCVLVVVGIASAGPKQAVPKLDHVIVVVFENREADEILGSGRAPTFDRLAFTGAWMTDYTAVAHPSLPNYLALVSGSTQGVRATCTRCSFGGQSLADTLAEAGKTWKVYAEGLPYPGFTGARHGRYAKKHVPFLYFRRVQARRSRLARVVPLGQLKRDLARHSLPSFSLVVPDLCHDMHDCSVGAGDRWLKGFLPRVLGSRELSNGVLFVVFDEGTSGTGGGGWVAALALGPRVEPGSSYEDPATHYSLLRTVEDALGLRHLGQAARAEPLTGIWR